MRDKIEMIGKWDKTDVEEVFDAIRRPIPEDMEILDMVMEAFDEGLGREPWGLERGE